MPTTRSGVDLRAKIASLLRWAIFFVVLASGIIALTVSAKQLSANVPLHLSLSRTTWGFVTFWATLGLLTAMVKAPSVPGEVRRVIEFFRTNYADSDRAGLASVMGPATRWKRRVIVLCVASFVIGLSALASMVWGTTPAGLWTALRDPNAPSHSVFPYLNQVWPTMFWWLVLSAGVFWICLRALGLGFATMPGRFSYRVRSARLPLAGANGARYGLSALAYVVQLTPALLLAHVALSSNPSSETLVHHVIPRWTRLAADDGVRAIAFHPILSAVLLGALPLAVLIILNRALERWTALDTRDWSLATDIAPALYLRTWEADRTKLLSNGLRRGILEHLSPPRRMSLAEIIGVSVETMAPVIVTAEPGGRRLSGVGSMWSTNEEWRDNVKLRAADALCVVLTADTIIPETGFSWEVEMVGHGDVTDRVALVLPPGMTVSEAQKCGGFLYEVALLPIFQGLGMADLPDDTRALVRDADGSWHPYRCSIQTDLGYYLCVMDAIARRKDDWELAARPETGQRPDSITDALATVSKDRFAREAALDGEPFGTLRMRLFHWFITSKWGRRYMTWVESLDD